MNILFPVTFIFSFTMYSLLRSLDVISTRQMSSILDIRKHEVNPIVVALTKRGWKLNNIFRLTWILFGIPIALLDATLNSYQELGFPLYGCLFGFMHLVAACNNFGLYGRLSHLKDSELQDNEREQLDYARNFARLQWRQKFKVFVSKNAFAFGMSILSLIALSLVYSAIMLVGPVNLELIFFKSSIYLLATFNMGLVIGLAVVVYFPIRLISSFLILRRYMEIAKDEPGNAKGEQNLSTVYIEIPVEVIRSALKAAESKGASVVTISNLSGSGDDVVWKSQPEG